MYGGPGFEILGFPCNQFNKQEPGANGTEIINGVYYVRPGMGFTPNFPLFEKVDVNGPDEHPLFTFLKSGCPPSDSIFYPHLLFYTPIKSNDITWNWETFLVSPDGIVVGRAAPDVDPLDLAGDIEEEMTKAGFEVPQNGAR